jgi:hypothetical protein
MAAVGILFSSLVKQRSAAGALLVLFAFVAFAGYGVIVFCYSFGRSWTWPMENPILANLAALWPVTPMIAEAGQFAKRESPKWIGNAWIITSLLWVAIGFFSLLLAGKAHARFGGVQEEA